ncbi:MAG: amidase [Frankiaceae bacterium]|nr:amidase [Frankiaceae bacterium]
MSTFITRLDADGDGPRLAVKDIIDVEGVPTTAGCRALERIAQPATADAACLAGARVAGWRIVGKTNLHELATMPIGTNPWFGTPVNPLDAALIPGGSSSGSAVAVANDDVDVALGSDTGGSIRIPSACCGTAGLKTTYGRVSLERVWPLAPSLDTVGPMARDISGLVAGMQLLEPGFAVAPHGATTIGRVRTSGDPVIEATIDEALHTADFTVVDIDWEVLAPGNDLFTAIYFAEMFECDHELAESDPSGIGEDVAGMLAMAPAFAEGAAAARAGLQRWRESVYALFEQVELLALPTLPIFPPRLASLNAEIVAADGYRPYTARIAVQCGRHAVYRAAGANHRRAAPRQFAAGWPAQQRGAAPRYGARGRKRDGVTRAALTVCRGQRRGGGR